MGEFKIKKAGQIEPEEKCNLVEKKSIFGRLNGIKASLMIKAYESFIGQMILVRILKKRINLTELMSQVIEDELCVSPIQHSITGTDIFTRPTYEEIGSLIKSQKNENYQNPYLSISDYYEAYKTGKITPLQVAEKIIEMLEKDDEIMNTLNAVIQFNKEEILKNAVESSNRYKEGNPLSIIDGVPYFSKEDIPKFGYIISCGTTDFYEHEFDYSAEIIDRLTEAGGIFMGITKMTMLGYGTIGSNPSSTHGYVRNPYNTNYYCGGSSTGSAAVVAAGLCPFSIGVDGLGSNRIPPAVTGMHGLKSTYGRIPLTKFINSNSTNTVPGPITNNIIDSAIIYGIIAGPSKEFFPGLYQPQVELPLFSADIEKLKKIKFGFDPSFAKMAIEPCIIESVFDLVEQLKTLGASIVEFTLEECWENVISCQCQFIYEKSRANEAMYGKKLDTMECCNAKLLQLTGKAITDSEYIQLKKQRTRAINIAKNMFTKFDIFITPTIGSLPPIICEGDDYCGVLDDQLVTRLTRFVALGSYTGIPGIALNSGFHKLNDGKCLPLSIQLQASWWEEKKLFEAAYLIEQLIYTKVRSIFTPEIFRKQF